MSIHPCLSPSWAARHIPQSGQESRGWGLVVGGDRLCKCPLSGFFTGAILMEMESHIQRAFTATTGDERDLLDMVMKRWGLSQSTEPQFRYYPLPLSFGVYV